MGAVAPLALVALGGIQAAGQISSARAEARSLERQASAVQDVARANAKAQQRRSQSAMGATMAMMGASGLTPEGSFLDVIENAATEAELDRQNILFGGESEAYGLRARAKSTKRAGWVNAIGTMMQSAGAAYGMSAAGQSASTGQGFGSKFSPQRMEGGMMTRAYVG